MSAPLDDLLLTRTGRVVLRASPAAEPAAEDCLRALDLELAALGCVLNYRARSAIGALSAADLGSVHASLTTSLAKSLGAGVSHVPLFRNFPHDVPANTHQLWLQKFAGFYLQTAEQPCLWCDGRGHTHVLSPCSHVVCDRCFDGANYSACPVCERQVDRTSPFFKPAPPPAKATASTVPLRRLDLAAAPDEEARALLTALVSRAQVLSPDDVDALRILVASYGALVLTWLPAKVPVRENVGHVVGTLLRLLPPEPVLAAATPWLGTATDLLRVIAVWSGADVGLQPTKKRVPALPTEAARWSGANRDLATRGAAALEARLRGFVTTYPGLAGHYTAVSISARRFKVAKMRRPLRRAILAFLDTLPEQALIEDMNRHPSAWVGVGEVLHPGEYAARFPRAARGFAVVRGTEPFLGFAAKAEALRLAGDSRALAAHLATRPGELWRRADHVLRSAASPGPVLAALLSSVSGVALPLLLTMRAHFSHRDEAAPARVYFRKGAQFIGPSAPDERPPIPAVVRGPLLAAIDAELLRRFAQLPPHRRAIVDDAVRDVVVPFNERTAARSLVSIPRGSSVALPEGDRLRLFLHWCQPPGGRETDIDLSAAFYDGDWNHTGVCSYYQLNLAPAAVHSGDRRDAPHPHGASEFVDIDRLEAIAKGYRYVVMVVNAYSGLPFSDLERAFAGVMRLDGPDGPHFDPRAVELKFDVAGPNGVYAPLLVDLAEGRLHWLDVSHRGELALNNVATSNAAITRFGPALLSYFGHHCRPSMFDLALLHAAARCEEVWLRGATAERFTRAPTESPYEFLLRLRAGAGGEESALPDFEETAFAVLLRGDVDLPDGSTAWALFRDRLTHPLAASDLLTVPAASEPNAGG